MRRYWINTIGNPIILFCAVNYTPEETITLIYDIKETNWLVYNVFKHTRINLIADDKTKWLRDKIESWLTKLR